MQITSIAQNHIIIPGGSLVIGRQENILHFIDPLTTVLIKVHRKLIEVSEESVLARIQYMGTHGFLKQSDNLYNQYKDIAKKIHIFINMVMKSRFKPSSTTKQSIITIINQTSIQEKQIHK